MLLAMTMTMTMTFAMQELPAPVLPEVTRLGDLSEQVDVMRVLLSSEINRTLNELWEERTGKRPRGNTVLWARTDGLTFTSHTRGFYVPGVGVVFSTEVPVQVRQLEDGEDAPRPDAWEVARRELHQPDPYFGYRSDRVDPQNLILDETSIEQTIEATLNCLRDYGRNIADLPAEESLIVGLRFTASMRQDAPFPDREQSKAKDAAHLYTDLAQFVSRSAALDYRQAIPQQVVIQVPLRLLADLAEAGSSPAAFRNQAEITRY